MIRRIWGGCVLLFCEIAAVLPAACSSQGAARVDAGKTAATSTASGLPDGALVFTGELPACNVPTNVHGASRTFLACAGCFASSGGACSTGAADNATDCQSCGSCVMGCSPNQYAVVNEGGGRQTLPAGCGGDLPVMQSFLDHYAPAEGPPSVSCCPCQ
jgi:hypothetical protein